MACRNVEQTIFFEAAQVTWGREQCRVVDLVDDVAGSLEGEYFDINVLDAAGVETNYYVLLDNGSTVDPAPAGKTKIAVVYTDNDSAATIAGLMQTAVDAVANVSAEVVNSTSVHIVNDEIGAVTAEVYTNAPSLTFTTTIGIGGDLGKTAEGIEITLESQTGEITSNQTGAQILDEIGQGQLASCSAAFIELSKERLETLIAGAVGGTFTPVAGTKLIGGGSSKLFQSLKALGGKLILHPIRLPSTDRSRDFVFWISAPKPETINYSGTETQQLNCTFTAYVDETKPSDVNLYAIGDWKQTGIVA